MKVNLYYIYKAVFGQLNIHYTIIVYIKQEIRLSIATFQISTLNDLSISDLQVALRLELTPTWILTRISVFVDILERIFSNFLDEFSLKNFCKLLFPSALPTLILIGFKTLSLGHLWAQTWLPQNYFSQKFPDEFILKIFSANYSSPWLYTCWFSLESSYP